MCESRDVLNEQIKISSRYIYQSETVNKIICLLHRSPGAGIPTSYGLDDRGVGVRVPVG
jgi:hypothetical protein